MSLLCTIHCTTQKGHFEHSWLFLYIHTNKVHSTKNHKQDFYTQLQDDNVLLNKICVLLCYFANLKHQALLKKACIIIVFFSSLGCIVGDDLKLVGWDTIKRYTIPL